MCNVLSLILLRFRVTELSSRAGESAGGCRGDRGSNEQWRYNSTVYEHWSDRVMSKRMLIAHNKLASCWR